MAFLNASLLVGLAAALIPLAIHLLGRRRPRHVQFSAMAFLEAVRRQQFRRLRLRHWLLLLLRTLFIVLLVLGFARPAMRAALGALGHRGQSAMVVVVDDGPSMTYSGARGNRFDWARQQLTALLGLVAPGDWAVLVRTSRPDLVLPLDARTLSTLREASPWSGDGVAALRHAADLLGRSDAANRELCLVTDLAGPPWRERETIAWPARVVPYLVMPPEERTLNLSVDSVAAGGELIRSGRPMEVRATIRNTGQTDVEDAPVALWIGGRRVQQRGISVPAHGSARATFSTTLDAAGWVTGRVELTEDPLLADNARWFALSVPPETRLLIVGENTPSRAHLAAIFASPGVAAPYAVETLAPREISREAMERADVIILNEQMTLDDRSLGWLRDALRRGAGVLLLVGPDTDLMYADRRVLPLIGAARITGVRGAGAAGDTTSYFSVGPEGSGSPVAGLFGAGSTGRVAAGRVSASSPEFIGYAIAQAPAADVLASFNTRDPWLIMGSGSAGRGAILTAGIDAAWGDLAYRGIVVPLLHRLVNALARPVSLVPGYSAGPGGRRTLVEGAPRLELEPPDGTRRPLLPLVAATSFGAGAPQVDLGMLSPTGIWRIRSDSAVVDVFAVNVDPAESDLGPARPSEFARRVGLPPLEKLGDDPAAEVAARRRGTELDIGLFLAALGCVVAELVLMRGIGRPDEAQHEGSPHPGRTT